MALIVAFILAVYATFISAWDGWHQRWQLVESARNAALLAVPFLTIVICEHHLGLLTHLRYDPVLVKVS